MCPVNSLVVYPGYMCLGDRLVVCLIHVLVTTWWCVLVTYLGDGLVVHVWVGDSLVVCLGDVPG